MVRVFLKSYPQISAFFAFSPVAIWLVSNRILTILIVKLQWTYDAFIITNFTIKEDDIPLNAAVALSLHHGTQRKMRAPWIPQHEIHPVLITNCTWASSFHTEFFKCQHWSDCCLMMWIKHPLIILFQWIEASGSYGFASTVLLITNTHCFKPTGNLYMPYQRFLQTTSMNSGHKCVQLALVCDPTS